MVYWSHKPVIMVVANRLSNYYQPTSFHSRSKLANKYQPLRLQTNSGYTHQSKMEIIFLLSKLRRGNYHRHTWSKKSTNSDDTSWSDCCVWLCFAGMSVTFLYHHCFHRGVTVPTVCVDRLVVVYVCVTTTKYCTSIPNVVWLNTGAMGNLSIENILLFWKL